MKSPLAFLLGAAMAMLCLYAYRTEPPAPATMTVRITPAPDTPPEPAETTPEPDADKHAPPPEPDAPEPPEPDAPDSPTPEPPEPSTPEPPRATVPDLPEPSAPEPPEQAAPEPPEQATQEREPLPPAQSLISAQAPQQTHTSPVDLVAPAQAEPLPDTVSPSAAAAQMPSQPANHISQGTGSLPAISAGYSTTLGFRTYVQQMHRLGARFYLYDSGRKKLLAGIDPLSNTIRPIDANELRGLSPRLRQFSKDPDIERLLHTQRKQFQGMTPVLAVAIPQAVENRISTQLQAAFAKRRLPEGDWLTLEGEYRLDNNRYTLHLKRAHGRNGQTVTIDCTLFL